MPGSRKGEISELMPIYKELVKCIDVNAIIIIPKIFTDKEIKELYGDLSDFKIRHNAHQELLNADFAFICSGTATLESAIIGTPFILSYIAKPFDYFIAKKLVKIEHVGLSNIMFLKHKGREIHPEFIQDDVTVQNLLKSYKEYDRDRFLDDSKSLRAYLKNGSSKRVAEIIES
jgi:lipid-A-disaccharide synthase